MKPFNLQEAQAGNPVMLRNGTPYQFGSCSPNGKKIMGWFKSGINDWLGMVHHVNGCFYEGLEHENDLFMAQEEKTGWINIYEVQPGTVPEVEATCGGYIYTTEEKAKSKKTNNTGVTVQVTWTE